MKIKCHLQWKPKVEATLYKKVNDLFLPVKSFNKKIQTSPDK